MSASPWLRTATAQNNTPATNASASRRPPHHDVQHRPLVARVALALDVVAVCQHRRRPQRDQVKDDDAGRPGDPAQPGERAREAEDAGADDGGDQVAGRGQPGAVPVVHQRPQRGHAAPGRRRRGHTGLDRGIWHVYLIVYGEMRAAFARFSHGRRVPLVGDQLWRLLRVMRVAACWFYA